MAYSSILTFLWWYLKPLKNDKDDMQNLLNELTDLLSCDDRLVSEGKLLKNKVIELALALDAKLLKVLLSNEALKAHFFIFVDDIVVFDKSKFHRFVSNKAFLPDSYTAYKNKIGLTFGENYVADNQDVVLAWAYKDCVLEGGQSKDDASRTEVFWNETLAPEQIDRLLSPKVLVNWKRFTSDGEQPVSKLKSDDNLLIKGNNLLAIHSLLKTHRGMVNLICIDPPYNTKTDSFQYNDKFTHSTWLTFMKSRLEVAKQLLDKNGTIFIFCDDNEQAYLKVLADEIFERTGFIATVVWRHSDNSNNDAKQFSTDHNYILVYSNNEKWESIKLDRTQENSSHYSNPNNDPRGPWFDGNPVNSPNPRTNLKYDITAPNGNVIRHPPNGWRWDKSTLKSKMATGEIFFNRTQTNIKRITYLNEQDGLPPSTLWEIETENSWFDLEETGHTRQAKAEQKRLFRGMTTSALFKTPKPEKVIQKILSIATNPGDLVMDFFMGSATTPAVALKMGRRFIGVEQMDYIHEFAVPRLQKVIAGEQGGISIVEGWQGGGEFVYCELAKANEIFVEKILSATGSKQLLSICKDMEETAFLSHQINPRDIDSTKATFEELSLEDQKKLLLETLDMNMLYVPLSEIEDETYAIGDNDKALNSFFYKVQ